MSVLFLENECLSKLSGIFMIFIFSINIMDFEIPGKTIEKCNKKHKTVESTIFS